MEKYFIINEATGYSVRIFDANFTGISTEIRGEIGFEKGSVDNILDTIRGTGLSLQLEASPLLAFEEFSDADEKTFTAIAYKNGKVFFNGFLKPDGITQSFVRDIWLVNLDFIDGLGALKDLSFVRSNGFNFTGKMSMYEVIKACLNRTGVLLDINSSIDVYYLDYTGNNILKDTYVNSDRFFKIDDDTIMSCEEVLNSILNLLSACITQQDGYWWIYRPNNFVEKTIEFINNTLNTSFVKNLYLKVGSEIDNFYPHHSSGNQQITTKGAISAYRLNYKYGFKKGELSNPNLNHDNNLIFANWTKATSLGGVVLVNDPNDTAGLIMKTKYILFSGSTVPLLTSEDVILLSGSQIDIIIDTQSISNIGENTFVFRVIRSDGFYLNNDGAWQNSTTVIFTKNTGIGSFTWTMKAEPVPNNCTVKVEIRNVLSSKDDNTLVEIKSVQIINNFNYDGRIGEFHTVSREVSPSSIVKENQEVYNGEYPIPFFVAIIL